MNQTRKKFLNKILFVLFLILGIGISKGYAAEPVPPELQEVGIEEHLSKTVSLDLVFQNEQGQPAPLRQYFDGNRPVLFTLVYYECPNLCNFLLNGLVAGLKKMSWTVGDRFNIVTVSIDPKEKPDLAAIKKQAYLTSYGRSGVENGWRFLTGSENEIKTLAGELGFKYKYDPDQKQFAHAAAVFVLTPQGKISRYLYGIEYNPRDLKLALLEASEGKIGNVVDRLLMFCYHYDPKGKKYALMAVNLMKLGAAATVVGLAIFLIVLGRGKRSEARGWKPEARSQKP